VEESARIPSEVVFLKSPLSVFSFRTAPPLSSAGAFISFPQLDGGAFDLFVFCCFSPPITRETIAEPHSLTPMNCFHFVKSSFSRQSQFSALVGMGSPPLEKPLAQVHPWTSFLTALFEKKTFFFVFGTAPFPL